ncbi:hypothetical protein PQX77_021726 [Marasmius sp. AFHP31]|nr:hypothetical protein PQX77_021726 [Marasmius sp. AFHP31]
MDHRQIQRLSLTSDRGRGRGRVQANVTQRFALGGGGGVFDGYLDRGTTPARGSASSEARDISIATSDAADTPTDTKFTDTGPETHVQPALEEDLIVPEHIQTVGVQRPNFGTSGRVVAVLANMYEVALPQNVIRQYDASFNHIGNRILISSIQRVLPVAINPGSSSEQKLPLHLTFKIMGHLQGFVAPEIFTPRVAYDGRQLLFATRELPLEVGSDGVVSQEVSLRFTSRSLLVFACLSRPSSFLSRFRTTTTQVRAPIKKIKVYIIRITKTKTINPEVLERFIGSKQSHYETVQMALTALNVVTRMSPLLHHPSSSSTSSTSFYTPDETFQLGRGLELWRGYFQSLRPSIDRCLVNVDVTTGMFYKPGPLIDVCLDFVWRGSSTEPRDPRLLSPEHGFPERQRRTLANFLAGARILVREDPGNGPNAAQGAMRICKGLSSQSANRLRSYRPDVGSITVADFYRRFRNRVLEFPDILCAEVGNGSTKGYIPLELCEMLPGQLARKQLPAEKIPQLVKFATQKPDRRLRSIKNGVNVLQLGQSDYIKQFGMKVHVENGPLTVRARVLKPPTLRYGSKSRDPTIVSRVLDFFSEAYPCSLVASGISKAPSEGVWNM